MSTIQFNETISSNECEDYSYSDEESTYEETEEDYSTTDDYSTEEDSEDDQLDLLESWTETMKKLKFMVELYNQECEKNKKYHEIFNRSKATIEEIKHQLEEFKKLLTPVTK